MDYFSCSALRLAANLVVSSWAYLLSIHSCLLDFLLVEFLELWVPFRQGVCWKPSLLFRENTERRILIRFKNALVVTSEVTGMQK